MTPRTHEPLLVQSILSPSGVCFAPVLVMSEWLSTGRSVVCAPYLHAVAPLALALASGHLTAPSTLRLKTKTASIITGTVVNEHGATSIVGQCHVIGVHLAA